MIESRGLDAAAFNKGGYPLVVAGKRLDQTGYQPANGRNGCTGHGWGRDHECLDRFG